MQWTSLAVTRNLLQLSLSLVISLVLEFHVIRFNAQVWLTYRDMKHDLLSEQNKSQVSVTVVLFTLCFICEEHNHLTEHMSWMIELKLGERSLQQTPVSNPKTFLDIFDQMTRCLQSNSRRYYLSPSFAVYLHGATSMRAYATSFFLFWAG